jgi:hypothetical protein
MNHFFFHKVLDPRDSFIPEVVAKFANFAGLIFRSLILGNMIHGYYQYAPVGKLGCAMISNQTNNELNPPINGG